MHCFPDFAELSICVLPQISWRQENDLEFFVRKFVDFCCFGVGFWRFILFTRLGHVSLFLHVPCDFFAELMFGKIAISPSLYGLFSYRRRPISLAGGSGDL